MSLGGYTDPQPANEEIQKLCNQVKGQVEAKTSRKYKAFKALRYRTQVVAGTNYLIKIHVDIDYLHVVIYQDLSDKLEVMRVKKAKKDDPLEPFN